MGSPLPDPLPPPADNSFIFPILSMIFLLLQGGAAVGGGRLNPDPPPPPNPQNQHWFAKHKYSAGTFPLPPSLPITPPLL